ncbi:hypothetical protein [Kitasatospora acidiphila]|uniref:hypothetical protein n=1 Tax=Kitasatospora acidiphila TaxID=2567942 RepID=UPI0015F073BD|nr:hypothetical protein [Kitasatospora acidiphila]
MTAAAFSSSTASSVDSPAAARCRISILSFSACPIVIPHQRDELQERDLRAERELDLLGRVGDLTVPHQDEEAIAREGLERQLGLRLGVDPTGGAQHIAVEHALGVLGLHEPLEHLRCARVVLSDLLEHPTPDQLTHGEPLLGDLQAPAVAAVPRRRLVDEHHDCHAADSTGHQ